MSKLEFLSDDNKNYIDYLKELLQYYDLKKKYNQYINTIKNKIINSNNDIQVKKKLYAMTKFKCINCGKEGGMIFNNTNNTLIAQCGNKAQPCDLNINIKKKKYNKLDDEILFVNKLIIDIKNLIIRTKLDYLFNYITQEKAVEIFDENKKKLEEYLIYYNELILLYKNIINNEDDLYEINTIISELNEFVLELKEYNILYNNESEREILKTMVDLNNNKIKNLDLKLLNKKYKYNSIIKDDYYDNNRLYQKKYLIKDLEFIKS